MKITIGTTLDVDRMCGVMITKLAPAYDNRPLTSIRTRSTTTRLSNRLSSPTMIRHFAGMSLIMDTQAIISPLALRAQLNLIILTSFIFFIIYLSAQLQTNELILVFTSFQFVLFSIATFKLMTSNFDLNIYFRHLLCLEKKHMLILNVQLP